MTKNVFHRKTVNIFQLIKQTQKIYRIFYHKNSKVADVQKWSPSLPSYDKIRKKFLFVHEGSNSRNWEMKIRHSS